MSPMNQRVYSLVHLYQAAAGHFYCTVRLMWCLGHDRDVFNMVFQAAVATTIGFLSKGRHCMVMS